MDISGLLLKETSDLFEAGGNNNKRHEQKNNFNRNGKLKHRFSHL